MILYELPADHRAGDREKGFMNEIQSFVAHFQSSELVQPGNGAFDHPACFTQTAAVGLAALGEHRADTLSPKGSTMGGRVVGTVALHTGGTPAGASASATQCGNSVNQGQQLRYIMGIGRREYRCERDAPSVRNEVVFAARFTPVSGIGSCFFPRAWRAQRNCRLSCVTTRFALPPASG